MDFTVSLEVNHNWEIVLSISTRTNSCQFHVSVQIQQTSKKQQIFVNRINIFVKV